MPSADPSPINKKILAIRALSMVINLGRPPKERARHTDGGGNFCAHGDQQLPRQDGLHTSMSAREIAMLAPPPPHSSRPSRPR
jgi:hypothetical protein